jgi:hypothetical protein
MLVSSNNRICPYADAETLKNYKRKSIPFKPHKEQMDSKMFKSGISVESVVLFAVFTFLCIFLIPCLYCAFRVMYNVCRLYKAWNTPRYSEVEQYSTSASSNDTESKPTHEIKTRRSF